MKFALKNCSQNLKDEHWPIQWAARRALVDMTGDDFGASWENWQEWWNKNKPK